MPGATGATGASADGDILAEVVVVVPTDGDGVLGAAAGAGTAAGGEEGGEPFGAVVLGASMVQMGSGAGSGSRAGAGTAAGALPVAAIFFGFFAGVRFETLFVGAAPFAGVGVGARAGPPANASGPPSASTRGTRAAETVSDRKVEPDMTTCSAGSARGCVQFVSSRLDRGRRSPTMAGVSDDDEVAKSLPENGDDHGESRDAVMDALWQRALEAWDDDKPHHALLTAALQTERLPDLAGRYRKLLEDPEKGARAKRRIDAIVLAATQLLMATKTPPREKVPWQWTASAAVFFVLVVSFLAYKILFRN